MRLTRAQSSLGAQGGWSGSSTCITQEGTDHEAPSDQHHRARGARLRRRRRSRGGRRQGPALPVPRRRARHRRQLRPDRGRGRQPRRAQGPDRPEPERDVHDRRQDRVPRLDGAASRTSSRSATSRPATRSRSSSAPRAARRSPTSRRSPPASSATTASNSGSRASPLFLYVGTVAGGQAGGHIALHVTGGNWRALRSMLGQSARPDVHLRRRHDLPALAGQGADRDRRRRS